MDNPMDFVKALEPWTVPKIVEILGVPERTVYSWRMGERLPPEWVQRLVLERMKRVKPDASD
jgi:antitoxin HicB